MKKQILYSLFLLTAFCGLPVLAQDCTEFKKLLDKTYNFKPSKLTASEQNAKSAEMDLIWEKVKANQKEYLPCLREALSTPTSDSFLKFDLGNLLIQVDQSDEAKKTLIRVYSEVDL